MVNSQIHLYRWSKALPCKGKPLDLPPFPVNFRLRTSQACKSIIRARMTKSIERGRIVRLDRNLYTFPENLKKINSGWLRKTKEEKVLSVIKQLEIAKHEDILKLSNLSQTQMYRAINNLLNDGKINRVKRNTYQFQ